MYIKIFYIKLLSLPYTELVLMQFVANCNQKTAHEHLHVVVYLLYRAWLIDLQFVALFAQ